MWPGQEQTMANVSSGMWPRLRPEPLGVERTASQSRCHHGLKLCLSRDPALSSRWLSLGEDTRRTAQPVCAFYQGLLWEPLQAITCHRDSSATWEANAMTRDTGFHGLALPVGLLVGVRPRCAEHILFLRHIWQTSARCPEALVLQVLRS